MPNRRDRIASIITQRSPFAHKITELESNLSNLDSDMRNLEAQRNQLLTRVEDQNIIGKLQEINFNSILPQIGEDLAKLRKLKVRFTRKTLNIAVVGRAGQGKSKLLQTLTGLDSKVIPDGKLNNCTGVRSIIHHNPNVTTYAEVIFHSERSFLDEVIYPYYDQLKLGAKPSTVNDFASQSLPSLPNEVKDAEPKAMYERLVKFHSHISNYRNLLGQPPLRIGEDQIREYVSQTDLNGQAVYFNYLAVKEVKITCSFPQEDLGQIALIDLPGLGDTVLGDKELLKKTIGEDVDFVLFVYMPQPGKRIWEEVDVQLYDTVRSALVELPVEKWSYMLLNKTDPWIGNNNLSDNSEYCEEAKRTITSKHINVKESIIANCAEETQASQVLEQIINYLETAITNLDNEYLTATKTGRLGLQNIINSELAKAKIALEKGISNDKWFSVFLPLFNQFWKNMTLGMSLLLDELGKNEDETDTLFDEKIDNVIRFCRENPPVLLDFNEDEAIQKLEELQIELNGYPQAYYAYMERLRTYISKQFLTLNESLMYSVNQAKSQVAELLIDKGKLGGLTPEKNCEFLQFLSQEIPEDLPQLKLGLQFIVEYKISFQNVFAHRIRKHLDRVTPNKNMTIPFKVSSSKEEIQKNFLFALQFNYEGTLVDCRKALLDFLPETNQIAYGMVEAFQDQLLRAEGVQDEWRIFLEGVRGQVWPDKFELLGEKTQIKEEWLNLIDRISSNNHLDLI